MIELLQQIWSNPIHALLVIGNLVIIESLLSIDNAAVLATMVLDLPSEMRAKTLRYGIIGAYIFRGVALIFAAFLVKFWYLKSLGGFYLLYLFFQWVFNRQTTEGPDHVKSKDHSILYKSTVGLLGQFWATVLLVELMDMAFSIDNVFAAVAFSSNIVLVWLGVFIGIFAMRFVAQGFVKVMVKYKFLESSAFVVIGVLGIKLVLSLLEHYQPTHPISQFLASPTADWATSILTVAIFLVPILAAKLFNFPKKS